MLKAQERQIIKELKQTSIAVTTDVLSPDCSQPELQEVHIVHFHRPFTVHGIANFPLDLTSAFLVGTWLIQLRRIST